MITLPSQLPSFLWHFIKKYWPNFLALQIFAFAWTVDSTLWPYLLKHLIDSMLAYQATQPFWSIFAPLLAMMAGTWLTIEIAFRLQGILAARLMPRYEAAVRLAMVDYVQYHSHRYFADQLAGSLANKISDISLSPTRIFNMLILLFAPTALAVIIGVAMFASINGFFALLLGGWVLSHLLISWRFAQRCNLLSEKHAEIRSNLQGKIVDLLSNMVNVRLFARHRFEYQQLQPYQQQEQTSQWQSLWYIEKLKIYLGINGFIWLGLILTGGTMMAWHLGYLKVGDVVLIFNATWSITMMAWIAGLELPNLFKEIGVCQQALRVIQTPHEIRDHPDAQPLKLSVGTINFEQVHFGYSQQTTLFKDFSIALPAGQKVGLVGLSGSGKTSFVNLLLRYYDIQQGRILIDHQDIAKVTQESLRQQITLIPQDILLFHRSIMDNIRYGNPDADDADVFKAAKLAHCDEFISAIPEGYQALVGERGVKLSGGQRQRIAIARAFLKNAPVLILDEATSALDSLTEKCIQDSLLHLMQGRTTLVIAHRLSTLLAMDRILVFSKGQIIEDGTHQELLAQGKHYAELWHMQSGGFLVL